MSKSKKGVKKGSGSAKSFSQRQKDDKMLWTMKVLAYAQQEMIDTMQISLNRAFGFGEKRQKQFHDVFEEVYAEVQQLRNKDTDKDGWYSEQKIEDALRASVGKYYVPREQRYDVYLITPSGEEFHL